MRKSSQWITWLAPPGYQARGEAERRAEATTMSPPWGIITLPVKPPTAGNGRGRGGGSEEGQGRAARHLSGQQACSMPEDFAAEAVSRISELYSLPPRLLLALPLPLPRSHSHAPVANPAMHSSMEACTPMGPSLPDSPLKPYSWPSRTNTCGQAGSRARRSTAQHGQPGAAISSKQGPASNQHSWAALKPQPQRSHAPD